MSAVLVRPPNASLRCDAWRSRSSECSNREPGRATRYSSGTVSMLCEKTAGRSARTRSSARAGSCLKSGVRTSTAHPGTARCSARTTAAKCAAPPSGRSSRSTDVITTCFKPSSATARATLSGSAGSGGAGGRPVATAQKPQRRVQTSPSTMIVAVPCVQHSKTFGQRASSQTVFSESSRISRRTRL